MGESPRGKISHGGIGVLHKENGLCYSVDRFGIRLHRLFFLCFFGAGTANLLASVSRGEVTRAAAGCSGTGRLLLAKLFLEDGHRRGIDVSGVEGAECFLE